MKTVKSNWEIEKTSEIGFWDRYLETKGDLWPDEYLFRTDANAAFQDYFVKYLPLEKDTIEILDVGAGPLTILGKKLRLSQATIPELRITCTDPLADAYMVSLKRLNIRPLTHNVKANAEELSNHFPLNYFDFVYMRNALDHSFDPVVAVGEMIKVVNENCYVILEHENNEAENESYSGLHQWNIKIEDGNFTIWNKSTLYNVTEHYKNLADITCTANETHNFISIRKRRS